MKKPLLTFAAAAAVVTGCQTESQWSMTQMEDMPANVQSAVRQEIGDANIVDVDVERRTGDRVYEVTYNDGGAERKLHVRNDGMVMREGEAGWLGASEEMDVSHEAAGAERARIHGEAIGTRAETEVRGDVGRAQIDTAAAIPGAEAEAEADLQLGTKLSDVPAAVRQTIERQAAGADIADIDKETRTGRTVYEVTFREPGKNPKLHIAQDGTLLSGGEANVSRTGADYNAHTEFDSSHDRIEAKREVRGGAEALTEGPSARAYEADEPAGAEFKAKAGEAEIEAEADLNNEGASIQQEFKSEPAGADTGKAEVNLEADSEFDASHERIDAKPEVRGGAEALTEGPSARSYEANEPAGAEFKAKAGESEIKAEADLSHDAASTERQFEAEPAGAEAEIKSSADYDASHDRIEAKREVRGGAEALTEGPSAAEAEESGAELKAEADVSDESAGAERRFQAEAAGAEAGTAHLRMNDLPSKVQTTIRQHGGEANISHIEKRAVYEVHFKDSSKGTLKIAEDGTMVEGNK